MKKSLIALAVLAASSAAMAQSSVTLFGIVDANVGYVNHSGAANKSVYGVGTSGNATSRLGFRGTEDLGGGLKAGFWLEGELFNDAGNPAGFNFLRRSTVSLMGGFGEVRLGRDYTPTYLPFIKYDVFGQVGIGRNESLLRNWGGSTTADASAVRQSNIVSYYSPNMSGFTGGLGYGFDEKTTGKEGRYVGVYGAYDNGPLSAALGFERRNVNAAGATDQDKMTLGASYDLKVAKLVGLVQQTKLKTGSVSNKYNAYALGVTAPVGAGEVKAQYAMYDQKAIDSKAHHLSLGYVHNLSKRTALYGTVAYMKNKDASALGLNALGVTAGGPGAGNNQTGMQLGIRHAF